MRKPNIHVVVPTGGREETIEATLLSCKNQDYEHMTVWICDNSFDSKTGEIVHLIDDKRFRLIRPEKRLCMAENWEFAISFITEGFLTIIGDDDALLPGCITHVSQIIMDYPKIPVVNHLPANYFWPNYNDQALANKLQMRPVDFEVNIYDSQPILKEVCLFKEWYGRLPFLYHGFVDVKHINKIKSVVGTPFFNFCSPDIYSDILLALFTERFVVVNSCLTLGGQSARSNGANCSESKIAARNFFAELPSYLVWKYECFSFSLHLYSALEVAFNSIIGQNKGFSIGFENLLANSIKEVSSLDSEDKTNVIDKLRLIYSQDEIERAFDLYNLSTLPLIPKNRRIRDIPVRLMVRVRRLLLDSLYNIYTRFEALFDLSNSQVRPDSIAPKDNRFPLDQGNRLIPNYQEFIDLSPHSVSSVYEAAVFLDKYLDTLQQE